MIPKIDWNGRKYQARPCSCCGMVATNRTLPVKKNMKGIRVCPGTETPEMSTSERTIKHVLTKNGTITVDVLNVKTYY